MELEYQATCPECYGGTKHTHNRRYQVIEQRAVEVFATGGLNDGKLLGYALFFAGSWDAWRLEPVGYRYMKRIGSYQSKDEAIAAIVE